MKFIISATNPYGEELGRIIHESEPEKAVLAWYRTGKKYPACAAIQADNEASAFKLLEWADRNQDKLEAYAKEYRCPYKPDYLKESISGYVRRGKSSMMWEYDMVSPFDIG